MQEQVDEDTDDDYLDDPIKLFDPEPGYSSQMQQNGNTNNAETNEEAMYQSDDELLELDTECTPVYIKLVDCMKFPWYFKKYPQQILDKTNVYDLVSDSENDVDIEYLSDNNDCFIVNDVPKKDFGQVKNNITSDSLLKSSDKSIIKTKIEKRLATMKLKENVELQKALEQRDMNKVDFKRNTGLIGMIITQKVVNCDEQEMRIKRRIRVKEKNKKKNKVFADAPYLLAADKMLSNIGTELIPISNNAELPLIEIERAPMNHDSNVTNKKMPVQYSLGKLSKKLIYHLKSKIIAKPTHNNNNHSNTIRNQNSVHRDIWHKTLNTSDKKKHSFGHVKNIKKTNKYKNNQIKAIERMIKDMQDSEEKEQKKDKIDAVSPHENANLNLSQHKLVVDVREPTSPILPCSTLAKKNRDITEIPKNDVTKKVNYISHLINKPKTTSDLNAVEKLNDTPEQFQNKNTFKSQNMEIGQVSKNDVIVKGQFSKNSAIAEDASNKNNFSDINLTRKNNASDVNHESTSHNEPNNSLHIVSIQSGYTPKKSTTETSINNVDNFSTSNVHVAKNKAVHTNVSNKTTQNIDKLKPNSLTPNYSDNNTDISATAKNIKQTSMLMHNPSASAVVLRPHRVTNTQSQVRANEPSIVPSNLSTFIPPQLYHHGLYLNFLPSLAPPPPPPPPPPLSPLAHSDREHAFIPRSTNCAMPNHRYPKILPPCSKRYQYPLTSAQCHAVNNSSQQSNIVPKRTIKGKLSGQVLPWRFSENGSQILQESFNARFGTVSQQKSNSQTNNTLVPDSASTDKCTVMASNKDCLGKKVIANKASLLLNNDEQKEKINSCKRPKSSNRDREEDLIKRKTEMLEILNNATKSLYESPRKAEKVTVNTFKKPRLLDKEETASTDNNEKKIEQQKGYSPPILPIPTYEKMLNRAHKHVPKDIVEYKKTSDKPIKRAPPTDSTARREDTKKISLEEYKRRTFKTCNKIGDSNKACKKINDYDRKRQNVQDNVREIVNRFSTESDLGYDSDSTVIL